MHRHVYCSTSQNNQDMEPVQMPINERMNKENVLCSFTDWNVWKNHIENLICMLTKVNL